MGGSTGNGIIVDDPGAAVEYKEAGVNLGAANRVVGLIKRAVQGTYPNFPGTVLTGLGSFSGVAKLEDGRVVGATTDGVGTKLKIDFLLGQHNTVGIDLVAMSVNDLIVMGIRPAFFLDYIAVWKLIPEFIQTLVEGIVTGCHAGNCALLGGETAEMPGFYKEGEYDMAGFAVGFASSESEIITGEGICDGMGVYGLPSSGTHSNGYSLIRRIFGITAEDPEYSRKVMQETKVLVPGCGAMSLGSALLIPTRIYVRQVSDLMTKYRIAGMCHITGGGFVDNLPRILPSDCDMEIDWESWEIPPIFRLIQETGSISDEEMRQVFNNGIGFVIVSMDKIEGLVRIGTVFGGGTGKVHFV
jgi:phosphoribosylformylglycinamidine cyclo-ligase